jgi:hypothetical protein
MGRSLHWYVVPKILDHDKSKICIDVEFEPERDDTEIEHRVYKVLNPDSQEIEANAYPSFREWIAATQERERIVKQTFEECTQNDRLCPKCRFYKEGFLFESPIVVASKHVSHSYSNPIWASDWNIKNMWMGSSTTDFVRRFSSERMYREISKRDVEQTYEKIERDFLGKAIRTSDVEAKTETEDVLKFLRQYMEDDNVLMIIEDEL